MRPPAIVAAPMSLPLSRAPCRNETGKDRASRVHLAQPSDPRHDLGQPAEAPILAGGEQKLHIHANMGPVRAEFIFDHGHQTALQETSSSRSSLWRSSVDIGDRCIEQGLE